MAIINSSPTEFHRKMSDDNKLWMGDLESYMDETFLTSVFARFGFQVVSIRWIRNYQTGVAARYCFVEFANDVSARQALESLNGQPIPGTSGAKRFKLNWANRKADTGQVDYNVFVADISRDVTSQQLLEFFQQNYKSVRYAKVVEDDDGGSKGYGFIRFTDEKERDLCLVEMDGAMGLGKRPLTIKPALAPKTRVPAVPDPDGATAGPVHTVSAAQWPRPHPLLPAVAYSPLPQPHPVAPHVSMPPLVYIEDLVDPNPPTSDNDWVIQQQKELFLALDSCRWKTLTDNKLS